MFIITGVGNPGKEYENTPHNAGYMFLDEFREYLLTQTNLEVSEWIDEKKIFLSDICKIKKAGELIGILQKPLTYMNNSGSAVQLLLRKYPQSEYILAHDDLDIPLGMSKIHLSKSPKGHRGVLSVESVVKSKEFLRIRLGIENRGERLIPGDTYVLIPYSKKELAMLSTSIKESISNLLSKYLEL
ncbi:MAG: Peptidyl-tRNA hydrolase [candidate division WS6 bacterium GW2011_GWE1_34_7]|uniref:Peptidyl-tRNA hydrolase n=1 Tax=candidate division WS6 bacterium GW2011_GWE1_34_7 TaxID=1619093 RepID=A0A0G0DTA8_9BACT|nr:MAG: Peptidyl-tRNA hydrolase [candidate division WS6 bacterium GW2011_GWE1_34_7]